MTQNREIQNGSTWRFDYLFAGSDDTAPELNARHGRLVTIMRPMTTTEDVGSAGEYDFEGNYAFEGRFEDGYTGFVWDFELVSE